jgi:uncharacterized protein YndB with AHSA1/START domain
MRRAAKHRRSRVSAAVRVARRFRAPPERVFRAWLEPDLAGRWLFATASQPMTEVDIDPRVGGAFRFAAHRRDGTTEHAGRYVEIVPPRRLKFTLALGHRPRVVTRVTAEINPLERGCELALVHEDVPADRAGELEARWTGILYGLGEMLASRPGKSGTSDNPLIERRS